MTHPPASQLSPTSLSPVLALLALPSLNRLFTQPFNLPIGGLLAHPLTPGSLVNNSPSPLHHRHRGCFEPDVWYLVRPFTTTERPESLLNNKLKSKMPKMRPHKSKYHSDCRLCTYVVSPSFGSPSELISLGTNGRFGLMLMA